MESSSQCDGTEVQHGSSIKRAGQVPRLERTNPLSDRKSTMVMAYLKRSSNLGFN
jgi:hypothetical protein